MKEGPFLFNPAGEAPGPKILDFVRQNPRFNKKLIFQSSGSTGKAKWIVLSRDAIEASATAANLHLNVQKQDVFGLALSDFHVGGYGLIERARLANSKLQVFSQKWNANAFVKFCVEKSISISSLVPTQVFDIVRQQLKVPASLRAIVVGGGALPHALYKNARALNWPILPSYGLTECASQVATAELSSLETNIGMPKGKILSHVEMQEVTSLKVKIKSPSLFEGAFINDEWQERSGEFFELPDKVQIHPGAMIEVFGRWEEEYKVLGEWIRWDLLKKRFQELSYAQNLFQKCELALFPDERRGNKIVVLCEEFNDSSQLLVKTFNAEVFPFERITHFYSGELPRSSIGKVQILKIDPLCLQSIVA